MSRKKSTSQLNNNIEKLNKQITEVTLQLMNFSLQRGSKKHHELKTKLKELKQLKELYLQQSQSQKTTKKIKDNII